MIWLNITLAALRRQAEVVRGANPDADFARFAIGGGTPTYLNEAELSEVFDIRRKRDGGEVKRDTGVRGSLTGHASLPRRWHC